MNMMYMISIIMYAATYVHVHILNFLTDIVAVFKETPCFLTRYSTVSVHPFIAAT